MNRRKNETKENQATAVDASANTAPEPESAESRRDPEGRPTHSKEEVREKNLDKTLADSFPTSDPPSSIPDPSEDDSEAA